MGARGPDGWGALGRGPAPDGWDALDRALAGAGFTACWHRAGGRWAWGARAEAACRPGTLHVPMDGGGGARALVTLEADPGDGGRRAPWDGLAGPPEGGDGLRVDVCAAAATIGAACGATPESVWRGLAAVRAWGVAVTGPGPDAGAGRPWAPVPVAGGGGTWMRAWGAPGPDGAPGAMLCAPVWAGGREGGLHEVHVAVMARGPGGRDVERALGEAGEYWLVRSRGGEVAAETRFAAGTGPGRRLWEAARDPARAAAAG